MDREPSGYCRRLLERANEGLGGRLFEVGKRGGRELPGRRARTNSKARTRAGGEKWEVGKEGRGRSEG